MPIISDIASLGNILLNIFRLLVEKPLYLLALIVLLLFFPLNILDILAYIFINILIVFVNVLIFLIIIPINIIVDIIEFVINALILVIATPINWLLALVGTSWTPPGVSLINIGYPIIPYLNIDFFDEGDTLIEFIFSIFGWSFPLW